MTNQTDRNAQAALVRAAASFVRDTYSGEWADDAAATLETDADLIERGEPCSLLRLAEAMQPAAVSAAVEPPADQTTPSLRAALRDRLAAAVEQLHETGAVYALGAGEAGRIADAELAVLYREWPWLRAEAEDAEPTDRAVAEAALAAVEAALCDTLLPDARGEALDRLMKVLPPTTDRAAEPVCICGHPNEQHFEDVCQTCGCGDYLEPQDAAEVIARWRQAALKARADRAAVLTEPERKMLAFALEITQEEIHARSLDLADDDKAALVSLRRMADETATETTAPDDRNAGPGWYEVITSPQATTCIAYVHEDGSLYLPEGDLTEEEFAFAAARGKAHRLVRADEQPAVEARQDGAET